MRKIRKRKIGDVYIRFKSKFENRKKPKNMKNHPRDPICDPLFSVYECSKSQEIKKKSGYSIAGLPRFVGPYSFITMPTLRTCFLIFQSDLAQLFQFLFGKLLLINVIKCTSEGGTKLKTV